jgi:hypothetical protein
VPFELVNNFSRVFVVRRALKFDFVLNDAISELDRRLIHDGWASEVLQIGPATRDKLGEFFDPENSFQVF